MKTIKQAYFKETDGIAIKATFYFVFTWQWYDTTVNAYITVISTCECIIILQLWIYFVHFNDLQLLRHEYKFD